MMAGVWGRSPQQALQSAGGQFMNEVSELSRRHIRKSLSMYSKRIRETSLWGWGSQDSHVGVGIYYQI